MQNSSLSTGSIGVVIADECAILRFGFRQMVESKDSFKIVGEAVNADAVLRA
jgi:DNA-binding NarL/FixJ family response regulator